MIRFEAPLWAMALPLILLAAWRWPDLGLLRGWRFAAWFLALAALSDPRLLVRSGDIDLWVLLDCSDSAARDVGQGREEWLALVEKAAGRRPGDRVRLVEFAGDIRVATPGESSRFEGDTSQTRFRLAVEHALSLASPSRANRLLAFTDGFSTDSPGGLESNLRRRAIPLDLRLLPGAPADDWAIASIRMPASVGEAEAFVAEIEATGPPGQSRQYSVLRGGERIGSGIITAGARRTRAKILLPPPGPGASRYEVRLDDAADPRPKNNDASSWVVGAGKSGLLLVSPWPDDPVAAALAAAGFQVRHRRDPAALSAGDLAGTRAVLIHGFSAGEIAPEFLRSLDFFVRSGGGGLAMFGGKASFGSGGYFESAIDPLLPVSMELKKEHRKLALSMAILLDRSGSMAMTTADGTVKMDLANRGAARAISLLGPSDAVAVFAVDSAANKIFPLRQIGTQSGRIQGLVRRIESEGGGIFIYEALQASWQEIRNAPGQKHILLFSDAADSEEPGDYKRLIAEMRAANATVSVIGLGTERDVDAGLLKEIAALGGGRIFFTNDAAELPSLFAQETVAVARSTFLEEPAGTVVRGGWAEIAQAPVDWPGSVDAYNLCYARPGASLSLTSKDEYEAPLVAHWRRGLGRVAAVTFPLAGDFSASARAWPGFTPFIAALASWLGDVADLPGATLRLRVEGSELVVELLHDPSLSSKIARHPPFLLHQSADGRPVRRDWDFAEPGRFLARLPFGAAEWLRGAVVVGEETIPFGPVSLGLNPEWRADPAMRASIKNLAEASGGRLIDDLGQVWKVPRQPGFKELRPLLVPAFLIVWLAGVFIERTGWRLPRLRREEKRGRVAATDDHTAPFKKEKRRPKRQPAHPAQDEPSPAAEETGTDPGPPSSTQSDARRRAIFARAKGKRPE